MSETRLVHVLQEEEWIRTRKEEEFLFSSVSNESSCSCYLAELAFPAYAYIDGHRLLPILGRRHHSAAISPGGLQIMLHRIGDTFYIK